MEIIQIYTAADGNYQIQVGALVQSIKKSQSEKIELTILGSDWTATKKNEIKILQTDCLFINFIDIDHRQFSEVKLSHKFPLATIYNILGPRYFFQDSKKLIYVDSDVIFVQDISELWQKPNSFAVAAVIDSHIGIIGNPSMKRPWQILNVNPMAKYLNTGLLVINVNQWNEQRITEKCLELLTKYEMPCIDQDALSLVLEGNFDYLHPKFNLMPFHFTARLRFSEIVENPDAIQEAISNPAIIHFHRSFFAKPWNYGCTHPNKDLWRAYASEFNKRWRRKLDVYNLMRNFVARQVGLTNIQDGNTFNIDA